MKLVNIKTEHRPQIGLRREIRLKDTPLKKSAALQISELRLDREEPFHINRQGYVLCFVVTGWMEAHCAEKNYKLEEGQGIVFEPGERHRINRGEGWMVSISSIDYDDLETAWEEEK